MATCLNCLAEGKTLQYIKQWFIGEAKIAGFAMIWAEFT